MKRYLGIDIGSTTIKTVLAMKNILFLEKSYERHYMQNLGL